MTRFSFTSRFTSVFSVRIYLRVSDRLSNIASNIFSHVFQVARLAMEEALRRTQQDAEDAAKLKEAEHQEYLSRTEAEAAERHTQSATELTRVRQELQIERSTSEIRAQELHECRTELTTHKQKLQTQDQKIQSAEEQIGSLTDQVGCLQVELDEKVQANINNLQAVDAATNTPKSGLEEAKAEQLKLEAAVETAKKNSSKIAEEITRKCEEGRKEAVKIAAEMTTDSDVYVSDGDLAVSDSDAEHEDHHTRGKILILTSDLSWTIG